MTEMFTASNGTTVWRGCQFWEVGKLNLSDKSMDALREYFRDERDRELGRWRDPKNPDFVVASVPNLAEGVYVLDEEMGRTSRYYFRRSRILPASSKFDEVAGNFFEAHPEKKPWQDAEQNDVWVLQIKDCHEPELYRFAQDTTCADSKVFRPVNNPARVFFEANSPLIVSAEKVWPENKES